MQTASNAGARIVHHGKGGELFLIFILNLVFTVLTLGIFKFWATTRTRRYIWSQTEIDGERLEYTGRGLELFIGFLKVAALGAVVVGLIVIFPLTIIALYISSPFLIGVAIYGATRYRLSHTRLRGIRFGLDGSAARHGWMLTGYAMLLLVTLGLATPWVRNAMHRNLINNARYGSVPFAYEGQGGDLFPSFLLAIVLTPFTLGLIWVWYKAKEIRYFTDRTTLGPVTLQCSITGLGLLGLVITNLLLLIFTLGLAFPWVLLRSIRYTLGHLSVEGELDYDTIRQEAAQAESSGEGLADALDVGAI